MNVTYYISICLLTLLSCFFLIYYRSCLKLSTPPPCMWPSRLCCLCMPLAVPLDWCLMQAMVCRILCPSMRDMPCHMPFSGTMNEHFGQISSKKAAIIFQHKRPSKHSPNNTKWTTGLADLMLSNLTIKIYPLFQDFQDMYKQEQS